MIGISEWLQTYDLSPTRLGTYFSNKHGMFSESSMLNCSPTANEYVIDGHGIVLPKEHINIGKVPYVSFWDKYPDAFVQLRTVFNLPRCWRNYISDYECKGIVANQCNGVLTRFYYKGSHFRYSQRYDKLFFCEGGMYVEKENEKLHFYMRELYNVRSEEIYEL